MPDETISPMNLMMIVNDPEVALHAASSGVDRIFVDLEYIGKHARQGHLDTWMSRHTADDISRVRSAIGPTTLLVRLNPWHEGSTGEIEDAIARGADLLMLPMFRRVEEVESFCQCVAGRVPVIPLAETAESMAILPEVARVAGVAELYIGLNDLHLSLGQRFMFEPLANGMLDRAAEQIAAAGLPWGFGGLARVGEGLLPAERVIAEHVRLGSTRAILSRTFHRQAGNVEALKATMDFASEVGHLRAAYAQAQSASTAWLEANRADVRGIVADVVRGVA